MIHQLEATLQFCSYVVQTLATPDLSFGSRKKPQLLMSRSQQSPQIYWPEGEHTKNSGSALILPIIPRYYGVLCFYIYIYIYI